jgi:hypothetical protein
MNFLHVIFRRRLHEISEVGCTTGIAGAFRRDTPNCGSVIGSLIANDVSCR